MSLEGWAQSRGHTGTLGSVAAGGAHASVCPPMGSLGVQQIHKPRSSICMMMAAAVALCQVPSK